VIIEEVDRASAPASASQAARFATMLLGAYQARQLNDAAIFAETLRLAFRDFPPDIGLKAVEKLVITVKWQPAISEVIEVLEGLMRHRQHARNVALAHLREHERRERERAEEERRRAELEELHPHLRIVHKWEKPFGRGRDVTQARWRWGVVEHEWGATVESWVARFGVDMVESWHEAVADMPKPPASIMAELERMAAESERKPNTTPE
jgi:hypothetical protein